MEILDKTKEYYVNDIYSKSTSNILSVDISTKVHGICIEVHGEDGTELLERVEIILNALNAPKTGV